MNRHAKASSAGSSSATGKRTHSPLAVLALSICALALTASPALAAEASTPILSNPSYTSVHVKAEAKVDGFGIYEIQYSTDQTNWVTGFEGCCEDPGPFEADLTHLKGATTYFVRTVATPFFSGEPQAFSPEPNPQFTTLPVDPPSVVSVDDASNVLYNIAKVSGRVNRPPNPASPPFDPNAAFNVDCHFEYVTDANFQPIDEQQSLTVRASGGTFTLGFEGQTTAPIAFDASAATVESELEGLSSVGAGNLSVSGGPGDEAGTSPYAISFGGSLGAKDVEQISVDPSALTVEGAASAEVQTGVAGQPEGFNNPSSVPCQPANPVKAEGESDVTAKLIGLTPGTTYHLRLHAENAGGTDTKVAADTFTTLSPVPAPGVQIDPVTAFTDSSAHLSGKIDTHGAATSWHFQCAPACGEPGGGLEGDFSEDEVSADLTGLEPDTTYQVELIATDEGGQGEDATSFKTVLLAPLAQTGFAKEVEADAATLTGKVNPHNSTVTYSFEYGLDESYGAATPAAPVGEIDNVRHEVSQSIAGLQPEATYHFRLSATSTEAPGKTTHGEDHTFTTQPASGPKACDNEQLRAENNSLSLPDCRAYELVSPLKKNGNSAGGERTSFYYSLATADGNGLLYGVKGPVPTADRGIQYYAVGRRSAAGWSAKSVPPVGSSKRLYTTSFIPAAITPSADLSTFMFATGGSRVPDNPETQNFSAGLYLGHEDDTIDWLSRPQILDPQPPPGQIPSITYFQPVGGSPDLSTVYFWGLPSLLPEDSARLESGLGGWGLYEYADGILKPAGTLPPSEAHPDGIESPGGAAPANTEGFGRGNVTSTSPEKFANQVSRDGSTLWFVSPDPGPVPGQGPETQLYVRHDGHSTLASHLENGQPAPSGVVPVTALNQAQRDPQPHQYVFGAPDGSSAIFQSRDALTPSAADDGSQKAYRYDVSSGAVSYLPGVGGATVVAGSDDAMRFLFTDGNRIAVWDHNTIKTLAPVSGTIMRPARATASGSAFLFSTSAAIPGFNNSGFRVQVYRYDLASEQLACLSCPPEGVTPTGNANFAFDREVTVPLGELVPNRGMSADGKRVFFDTPDSLLPTDVNGVRDVYEWTPGDLSLISSGKSPDNSVFLDNSADGSNVFFATAEGLDPRDTDDTYDAYDARIGGGFRQAAAVSPCLGNEVCKKASPPAPNLPGPATNSFSGSGNPPPCPKGKVRKRGNCVKQPARKHKNHKKNKRTVGHGRGGSK